MMLFANTRILLANKSEQKNIPMRNLFFSFFDEKSLERCTEKKG